MERSTKKQTELLRKAAVLQCHADKLVTLGERGLADSFAGKARVILRKVYRERDIVWGKI